MKPSEVIREAKHVLFERGWHQGGYAGRDGSVCAEGALCAAARVSATYSAEVTEPLLYMNRALGRTLFLWNDEPGRTFDEVIELFDKAEKLAEAAENA